MNEELSVIELIMGASLTVKAVMATLVAASVVSWFMIVQRIIILLTINVISRKGNQFPFVVAKVVIA